MTESEILDKKLEEVRTGVKNRIKEAQGEKIDEKANLILQCLGGEYLGGWLYKDNLLHIQKKAPYCIEYFDIKVKEGRLRKRKVFSSVGEDIILYKPDSIWKSHLEKLCQSKELIEAKVRLGRQMQEAYSRNIIEKARKVTDCLGEKCESYKSVFEDRLLTIYYNDHRTIGIYIRKSRLSSSQVFYSDRCHSHSVWGDIFVYKPDGMWEKHLDELYSVALSLKYKVNPNTLRDEIKNAKDNFNIQ